MYDRPHTKEAKEKISKANKGKRYSPKTEFKKGHKTWNKGTKGICKPNSGSFKKGDKSSLWKGGRVKNSKGYILIYKPNHPYPHIRKYVYEHRLVMEKHLGRYLTKKEVVHHINGIVNDNRIENLMLFANLSEHFKYHKVWLSRR